MNNYDKYINDELLSKIFKSRLEEQEKEDLFDIEYNPRKVYTTCANPASFNPDDAKEAMKLITEMLDAKRHLELLMMHWFDDSIFDIDLNEYVGKTEEVKKPVFSICSSILPI